MDRRSKYRLNLHPAYLPMYDALCGILDSHWQPYQGFRTFQEQDQFYAQGRTTPGKIVTHAEAGESAHNYGCATDWILWDSFGHPIWIESSDTRWKEYLDALEKVGLKSGKGFDDIDHNELHLKCSWVGVKEVWSEHGMERAMTFIQRMMI